MSKLRGRFEGPTGDDMRRFSSSLEVDLRMLDEEIDGSLAHAFMLGGTGLITTGEADQLRDGLETIREELHSGSWCPDDNHEDIHLAIEARLVEKLGDLGKKLHTARSRNDQVATDVRLWLKRRMARIDAALRQLVVTLIQRVEEDGRTLMPGYTHLQRGQPILLGHQILAHTWALTRDRDRFRNAMQRLDHSPLGACAMAGTAHPIDRECTAEQLGFAGPVENAMDAVAARDHEQEVAAHCAICMTHLSRMAEELVLWSSSEFGLVRIDERYATGSSIMPQKRNPDAAELVRGKAALVAGNLQTLLSLVRSLPLAYNRDLQESRGALFDAVDTTVASVEIMTGMLDSLHVHRERFETELRGDASLATELADFLASRGVPFREAHEIVGRLVLWCEQEGTALDELPPGKAAEFHTELAGDLSTLLDPRAAAERRTSRGGTAWSEVQRQVELLRAAIEADPASR
jgi:argininosuccinate lyase